MSAIALLPALLLATPTIDGATVSLNEGNLSLEIATSEPVARHDVRVKLDGKTMSVYVDGAEAVARKSFGTAELGGSILPRAEYAKIEVPLKAELGCAGKAAVTVTDGRVKAVLPCKGKQAPAAAATTTPTTSPSPTTTPTTPTPTNTNTAGNTPTEAKSEAPKLEAKPAPKAPELAIAPAKSAPRFSSMPMMVMVGLLLVGGYFFWRKKKQRKASLIRILETASLGPKRALVIAEVNGEKMILGTSEAGISLLSPMAGAGAPAAAKPAMPLAAALTSAALANTAAQAANRAEPVIADEEGDSDDLAAASEGEGGLLAKLFKRRRQIETEDGEDGPSTMAEDFRDLLNDSLEDEELRRRLQAGLGGRTQ